jgi:hypothetical protein
MNTQQLIHTLASDLQSGAGPTRSHPRWARLAAMTGLASLVSLAAILLLLAPSPHLAHGPGATIGFSALAGVALAPVPLLGNAQLSYPEGRLGLRWLLLPLGILLQARRKCPRRPVQLVDPAVGHRPGACFLCVTALSLPILVATLVALRDGARPTRGSAAPWPASWPAVSRRALYASLPGNSLLFVASGVPAVLTVTVFGARGRPLAALVTRRIFSKTVRFRNSANA